MALAAPSAAALEARLETHRLRVDEGLRRLVDRSGTEVERAARDALFAPAKRLRPILGLMVSEMFGADPATVLPAGCAVEMVHTASLVLDDLPCMDDATLRRGRPATHVAYGEASAILAAFALINRAFEVLAAGWPEGPDAAGRADLARDLARAIGMHGMIAGQEADLAGTDRPLDFETLEFIHSRKTGALFTASAAIGARAARARPAEVAAVTAYAKNLGLAFQIVDDLIDLTGQSAEAGKDVGQDRRKTTFVSFAGVEGARQLAGELIEAAEQALAPFAARAQGLRELARYVVTRRR